MSQLLQATCPKCGRGLRIPSEWTNSLLRCKQCGHVIRTANSSQVKLGKNGGAATPPGPPARAADNGTAVEPAAPDAPEAAEPQAVAPNSDETALGGKDALLSLSPTPISANNDPLSPFAFSGPAIKGPTEPFVLSESTATRPNPYLAQIRQRRQHRRLITAGVLLVLAAGVGAAVYFDLHVAVINQFRQFRDKSHYALEGVVKNSDTASATVDTKPTAPSTAPAPVAPKTAHYWGRALLVGVKNYLYVNPLNPGYRPNKDVSSSRDPLGLTGLRQVLVKSMGFPSDQVAELSDVAVLRPIPPLKQAIIANMESFLGGCRPNDRVVLALVCHAIEVEGKNYFVPLEGEPAKTETLIPVAWLYEQLAKCASKHKLVILDLSPFDPEQGSLRQATGPLSKKLEEQLQKPPPDTLVWLSCSAGEHSYQFASNGFPGSVFMRFLQDCGMNLVEKKKNRRWNPAPGAKEGSIPLLAYIPAIDEEITKFVKERAEAKQTPKLFGTENTDPDPALAEPPPPVAIQPPTGVDAFADPKLMEGIYQELSLVEDASQAITADSMPPFWAKNMDAYAPDYTNADQFDQSLAKSSLRRSAVEAARLLRKHTTSFRKTFRSSANDAQFKRMLEREQETPATIDFDLLPALDQMEKAAKERDKEKAKRWQANFDFTHARLLERLAYSREYNFVLGNRLRKDSPVLKDPKNNNGWRIVPTDRVQDKEAKAYAAKRQKILERLIKEHPGTPWEVLARKDLSTNLGLTVQEAKVE